MMDYEKSDLAHAQIPYPCPACGTTSLALAYELEAHSQVSCTHCGCIHTVDIEERKDKLDDFWQMVKNFKNGSS